MQGMGVIHIIIIIIIIIIIKNTAGALCKVIGCSG